MLYQRRASVLMFYFVAVDWICVAKLGQACVVERLKLGDVGDVGDVGDAQFDHVPDLMDFLPQAKMKVRVLDHRMFLTTSKA